jgi:hypothetical protein
MMRSNLLISSGVMPHLNTQIWDVRSAGAWASDTFDTLMSKLIEGAEK